MSAGVNKVRTSPPEKVLVACPICGSSQSTAYLNPVFPDLTPEQLYGSDVEVRGVQNMVKCEHCGHIYESPRYSDNDIKTAYIQAPGKRHDSMFDLKVKTFSAALQKIGLAGKGKCVLDVGCASGAFVKAALDQGWTAQGVEPSEGLVEFARDRGLDVRAGVFEDIPPTATFDMITFWDVLEHLTNPREILEKANSQLVDHGHLIINVPDHSSWIGRIMGKRSWWIMSVHLSYFGKKSILELLNRTGFELDRSLPYFQVYTLGYLLRIAANLKIPTADFFSKHLPRRLLDFKISYYAGQTTFICRKRPAQ